MSKHIVHGTNWRGALAIAAVIGSVGQIHALLAQGDASLTVDVGECVTLQSPEDRFACYERKVDAAQNRAVSPGASPAARSVALPGASPQAASRPGTSPLAASPPAIVATVTAVEETVPNAYLITLDNGQVWRQNRPQWYPLRPGHRVNLTTTRWGKSYRLTVQELKGFIQVERVQ
jgi:hypothetical protein